MVAYLHQKSIKRGVVITWETAPPTLVYAVLGLGLPNLGPRNATDLDQAPACLQKADRPPHVQCDERHHPRTLGECKAMERLCDTNIGFGWCV